MFQFLYIYVLNYSFSHWLFNVFKNKKTVGKIKKNKNAFYRKIKKR